MTPTHRVEAVLTEDGKLSLKDLPFVAGQAVEVVVVPIRPATTPVRGAVLRYDRPTEPVAEAEWDALQ